jgi:hypothetical protein
MLTFSKFSNFSINQGFAASVPNRGNNFTSPLSLNIADNIAIGNNRYFITNYNNGTIKSGTSWGSLSTATVGNRPYALSYSPTNNEYLVGGDNGSTNGFGGVFWRSTNGTTWTSISVSTGTISQISPNSLIWDGSQFIGGGFNLVGGQFLHYQANIYSGTTANGIVLSGQFNGCATNFVASNQSTVVLIDQNNSAIYYTTNLGSTGTKATISPAPTYLAQVAYGNGNFIAPSNGYVLTSSDGINWTSVSGAFGSDYLTCITYFSGVFYIMGASNVLYMSVDGINWTKKVTAIPTGGTAQFICVDANLISVQWSGSSSTVLYTSA